MIEKMVSFAKSHGFDIGNLALDGKVHRFCRNSSKKNAWYIGHQNHHVKTGDVYIYSEFGDWKTMEKYTYKPDKISRADLSVIKKQIEQSKKAQEKERLICQKEAELEAVKILGEASTMGLSKYINRKKLTSLFGTKIDKKGTLLVPMHDIDDNIKGVQRIYDNGKYFLTGQATKGLFYTIGNITEEDITYICEGFATGASIAMATNKSVVITFSCHNMVEVAKILQINNPSTTFIVAGDDDRFTEKNAGRDAAEKIKEVFGITAIFPKFKVTADKKAIDFNDLHCLESLDEVKNQLKPKKVIPRKSVGFYALGSDEGVGYFYDNRDKTIVRMTSYSDEKLLHLADLAYWENVYPGGKGPKWLEAKNDMIKAVKKVGPFDNNRIRGTGVWQDKKRYIVNTGTEIYPPLDSTRFVYVQTKNKMPMIHKKPLTTEDTVLLREVCEMFKWREDKSGFFLAGWLAIARIAGALPIRPHVWVTGGKSTGKSTVMEKVVKVCLGSESGGYKYFQGGSTEAGIRQEIKSDSLPIIFDEFETDDRRTSERVQVILELLRQTWSMTGGKIIKGSAGGTAQQYSLNFAALVSSVRVNLQKDTDKSRFSVLDLAPHGNDLDHFDKLLTKIDQLSEEYGDRLFSRSFSMISIIVESQRIFQREFALKFDQRTGQQYGMLLAGYYSLVSDEPVTKEVAADMVAELSAESIDQDEATTDEMDLVTAIRTSKVRVNKEDGLRILTFEDTIENLIGNDTYKDDLKKYGINIHDGYAYIANVHSELSKILKNTKWEKDWRLTFRRLKGVEVGSSRKFDGKSVRTTKVPLLYFQ